MARPSEYENGTYDANGASGADGVHGAHGPGGGPQVRPNVYYPQPEPSPAYDGYTDPAAAHGWQNAYDETTRLPPVTVEAHGPGGAHVTADPYRGAEDDDAEGDGYSYDYDYVYEDGRDYGGDHRADRADRGDHGAGRGRRRARRKPGAWRSRRVAVAAGAVGASAAALIAGFSLSGSSPSGSSSPGGAQGKGDRTSPTAEDSATPTKPAKGPASPGSAAVPPPTATSPSATTSPSASAGTTEEPSPTPTTTGAAPSTASAPVTTTPPGNSGGKPGRGQGNTKKPG